MMKQRGPARAGNRERLGRGSPAGVLESLDTASSPALRALAAVRYRRRAAGGGRPSDRANPRRHYVPRTGASNRTTRSLDRTKVAFRAEAKHARLRVSGW